MTFLTKLVFVIVTINAANSIPSGKKMRGRRLAGGFPASIDEFPWHVSLHDSKGADYNHRFCGGSIIAQNYILTAGHCVRGSSPREPSGIFVYYAHDNYATSKKMVGVSEISVHPSFTYFEYDVAVLRTSTPLDLSSESAASVPLRLKPAAGEECAEITGWAAEAPSPGSTESLLRWARVKIVDFRVCHMQIGETPPFLTQSEICAQGPNRGICSSDSGGALVVEGKQIGIAKRKSSLDKPCGQSTTPDVFTSVVKCKEFIDKATSHTAHWA